MLRQRKGIHVCLEDEKWGGINKKWLELPYYNLTDLSTKLDISLEEADKISKLKVNDFENHTNILLNALLNRKISINELNDIALTIDGISKRDETYLNSLIKILGIDDAIYFYKRNDYLVIEDFKSIDDLIKEIANITFDVKKTDRIIGYLDPIKVLEDLTIDYDLDEKWCLVI